MMNLPIALDLRFPFESSSESCDHYGISEPRPTDTHNDFQVCAVRWSGLRPFQSFPPG